MALEYKMYTDGSFNSVTGEASGGFIILDSEDQVVSGQRIVTDDRRFTVSQSNAGELVTAAYGLSYLNSLMAGKDIIVTVYYDYTGIANFIKPKQSGGWTAAKFAPKFYVAMVNSIRESNPKMQIQFQKVKAHTGDYWNEIVDAIAKGAYITPAIKDKLQKEIKLKF